MANKVNSINDLKNLFKNNNENEQLEFFNKIFRIMMFKFLREEH